MSLDKPAHRLFTIGFCQRSRVATSLFPPSLLLHIEVSQLCERSCLLFVYLFNDLFSCWGFVVVLLGFVWFDFGFGFFAFLVFCLFVCCCFLFVWLLGFLFVCLFVFVFCFVFVCLCFLGFLFCLICLHVSDDRREVSFVCVGGGEGGRGLMNLTTNLSTIWEEEP